ncbi:hypothetical protein [Lentzea sp. NPDC092896]|uniref:hypothetical protein n=1 Tax=Lentzea sp. NPDC092896 TaxID=3364127 RepID=UPI00382594C3
MTFSALDDVLRTAASVRVCEIDWYGEVVVDLTRPGVLDGLRAAMVVESTPGVVCACSGQARFEFFGAQVDSRRGSGDQRVAVAGVERGRCRQVGTRRMRTFPG